MIINVVKMGWEIKETRSVVLGVDKLHFHLELVVASFCCYSMPGDHCDPGPQLLYDALRNPCSSVALQLYF